MHGACRGEPALIEHSTRLGDLKVRFFFLSVHLHTSTYNNTKNTQQPKKTQNIQKNTQKQSGEPYFLGPDVLERAFRALPIEQQQLLERTADRIRKFAEAQRRSVTEVSVPVLGGWAGPSCVYACAYVLVYACPSLCVLFRVCM